MESIRIANNSDWRPGPDQHGRDRVMLLADRIYIFCPEVEKGIMFYDQSPRGAVDELAGSLPIGKFWSSGEHSVSWDRGINGVRDNTVTVNELVSLIVNSVMLREGETQFRATTIMVTKSVFVKVLAQIHAEKPVLDPEEKYKVIDLGTSLSRGDVNSYNKVDSYNKINEVKPGDYGNKIPSDCGNEFNKIKR